MSLIIQFPNINTYSCVGTAERVSGTRSWQLTWDLAMPGNGLLLAKVYMEQYIQSILALLSCMCTGWLQGCGPQFEVLQEVEAAVVLDLCL